MKDSSGTPSHAPASARFPWVAEEDLGALAESIGDVLSAECGSRLLHDFYDGRRDLGRALWSRAAELGWLAVGLPEDLGGLGMGPQGLDVLHRELGRAYAPGPFLSTLVAAQWLAERGDPGLRVELARQITSGELTVALHAGGGSGFLKVSGGRAGGAAAQVLNPAANLLLAPAETEGRPVLALVRLDPATARSETVDMWDRTRMIGRLSVEGAPVVCLVPDADGTASDLLQRYFALAVAADSVGGARRIAEQTIAYMKTRTQFGQPIAGFQALKHRAADLMVAVVKAEELTGYAVDAAANGAPSASMWASLAKAGAAEAFRFVAEDCVQLHGGVGFTWEFDCHIALKRALLNQVLGGDGRFQRDLAEKRLAAATAAGLTTAEFAA